MTENPIATIRAELRLSQREMARELHVSQSLIAQIERGRVLVSPETALRVAERWPAEAGAAGGVQAMIEHGRVRA